MTVVVAVLVAVIAAQWAVIVLGLRHIGSREDQHLAERDSWARERYDLNMRLTAPQVAPLLPPPAPTGYGPGEPIPSDDEEPDQSDLVGTIA